MQQVETEVVMLEATRDVELRPGLVLPPGLYSATETYYAPCRQRQKPNPVPIRDQVHGRPTRHYGRENPTKSHLRNNRRDQVCTLRGVETRLRFGHRSA
jgi:hypothetical protein